jgi:phage host-nuclease inhibitor protein Gam
MNVAVRRLKLDATPHPVPQTQDDAVAAIAEIGVHQRERTRIETLMNDELARIREGWEKKAAPHQEAIKALQKGVQIWCEANRERLTQGGKVKYAHLASGEIKWRMTPPKVVIRAMENVLDYLRMAGLNRLIRVKEEVNKDAILAEPETVANIKGISITQREEFIVIPFETALESVS